MQFSIKKTYLAGMAAGIGSCDVLQSGLEMRNMNFKVDGSRW